MPGMRPASREDLEQAVAFCMGARREGILKLYVLHESGDLVGVFSSQKKLTDYIALCPTVTEFQMNPDGLSTFERDANYRTQVVNLDEARTDA